MIKLDSLERWSRLEKGSVLTLPGEAPRRVKLNVNSPGWAKLFIVTDDGEPVFLACAERRDVVEFAAGGDIRITTEDDDVFIYTSENEPTFTIIENAEVFTQIANRAARNPDLEHIMFMAEQNMARRFAAMEQEINHKVTAAYDAGKQSVAHSDAPGTVAPLPASEGPEQNGGHSSGGENSNVNEPPSPAGAAAGNAVGGDENNVGSVVHKE